VNEGPRLGKNSRSFRLGRMSNNIRISAFFFAKKCLFFGGLSSKRKVLRADKSRNIKGEFLFLLPL
jgi:hypothetical protein